MKLRNRTKHVPKPLKSTTIKNNSLGKTRSQTQERKNARKKKMIENNSSRLPHLDEDLVIEQILTRLPVKSLMRFKCVSKRWKSLIRKDSRFMKLHFSHSEKRPCLFVLPEHIKNKGGYKMKCYLTGSLLVEKKGIQTTTLHNLSKKESNDLIFDEIIGPVNGLFGVVKKCIATVTIYNFSTQEVVQQCFPPTLLTEFKRKPGYYVPREFQTYFFGFDSTTMKYKVMCIWRAYEHVNYSYKQGCEVFTLGSTNTWKTIDEEIPTCCFEEKSVYADNCIYWRSPVEDLRRLSFSVEQLAKIETSTDEVLVAFELASEKFRVIPVPNCVPPRLSHSEYVSPNSGDLFFPVLLEVDGRVAVSYRLDSDIIELYVFDDDRINKENANATGTMMNWTKESIELPIALNNADVYPLPGSDDILLICNSGHATIKIPSLYSYNRKKKTFKMLKYDGCRWGSKFHNPHMPFRD